MPKVTQTFKMVRPGDVHPTAVEEGEEVTGRVAEVAKHLGCLAPAAPEARKGKAKGAAPENKAL